MCAFWLSLVKKDIIYICKVVTTQMIENICTYKAVSQFLDLHFFFLWSWWNASDIPGENVIQPKNKSDYLVHNLYTVRCNVRDPHNRKLLVLTWCLCRLLIRKATIPRYSDNHQRRPAVDGLGKAEIWERK